VNNILGPSKVLSTVSLSTDSVESVATFKGSFVHGKKGLFWTILATSTS
jgi:hypothetical protein